jgi:hypothetical protein
MIEKQTYDRDQFLSVFDWTKAIWDQRGYRNENALAFGLSKAGRVGEYFANDMLATALTIIINRVLKIDGQRIAALVMENWEPLLENIAREERIPGPRAMSKRYCFVIGLTEDRKRIRAEVGVCEDVIDKFTGDMTPHALPLDLLLRKVREAAKEANPPVKLPKYFTPAEPGTEAWTAWIAEIKEHRRLAEAKDDKSKAKRRSKAPT